MAHRLFEVRPGPELRFGEPKQAHRFERSRLLRRADFSAAVPGNGRFNAPRI
jgi:hypothetical protein